jgi:hypothetical protein
MGIATNLQQLGDLAHTPQVKPTARQFLSDLITMQKNPAVTPGVRKKLANWLASKGLSGTVLNAARQVVPITDTYAIWDLVNHAAGAAGKEIGYNATNALPAVNYEPTNFDGKGYSKNYDAFGDAAVSNYGVVPHDFDLYGTGKYIIPAVRNIFGGDLTDGKSSFSQNFPNLQNLSNLLTGTMPKINTKFEDLPYHRQLEEQLYGRPIETRRTPDWLEIIGQAIVQPYSGQFIFPKGKDLNSGDWDLRAELQNVFGDVGSNYGMQEGVLSNVTGWTKDGQRRRTNIYREEPLNGNRQSLTPYSTNPYSPYSQTKNDAKLLHGIGGYQSPNSFYSDNYNTNDYTYKPELHENDMTPGKEWMVGAALSRYGRYGGINETAYWQPEKTWKDSAVDWYNSTFNNNQTQYNPNPSQPAQPAQPAQTAQTAQPAQPAQPTPTSKWKPIPTPTLTPTVTKSLTVNKRKFEESTKSLNFTKSLSSGQNKYDTTSKNQIPFRNKYLK